MLEPDRGHNSPAHLNAVMTLSRALLSTLLAILLLSAAKSQFISLSGDVSNLTSTFIFQDQGSDGDEYYFSSLGCCPPPI